VNQQKHQVASYISTKVLDCHGGEYSIHILVFQDVHDVFPKQRLCIETNITTGDLQCLYTFTYTIPRRATDKRKNKREKKNTGITTSGIFLQEKTHIKDSKIQQHPRLDITDLVLHSSLEALT
jgi:hypothetical protein